MRRVLVVAVGVALLTSGRVAAAPKDEAKPPDPAVVMNSFDDADPVVRDAAGAALVGLGDAALPALAAVSADASAARREGASRVRAAIGRAKRLASKPKDSVAWWMAFEDVVERESPPLRDAVLLAALEHRHAVDVAIEKRCEALAAVIAFCREWSHGFLPLSGSPEEARRAELERRIQSAGVAAAPALFRLMAGNHVKTYFAEYGSISWMMVVIRAGHAARLLRLKDAVPFLLYDATGMSLVGDDAAYRGVDEIAGTQFGAQVAGGVFGLDPKTAPAVAWWKEHRGEYAEGLGYLVDLALAEAHADLATRLATGAAPRGFNIAGQRFEPHEEAMAKRLAVVVGDEMPLRFTGDIGARLFVLRAVEVWAAGRFPR